jgi:hypothetical protein
MLREPVKVLIAPSNIVAGLFEFYVQCYVFFFPPISIFRGRKRFSPALKTFIIPSFVRRGRI